MSNYIEYNDKIAFHPGYYIKEIIEESGLIFSLLESQYNWDGRLHFLSLE